MTEMAPATPHETTIDTETAYAIGVGGYTFLYPLVLMD
jgi:hypothetical protein